MPDPATVWRWKAEREDVLQAIARAREAGFDAIAEECMEIADNQEEDTQRSKVRIWTRLELLKKWCPKRYGDHPQLENSGEVRITAVIGGDAT